MARTPAVLILCLGLTLVGAPAKPYLFLLQENALVAIPSLDAAVTVQAVSSHDLNQDGNLETLLLDSGHLSIQSGDSVAWQSPTEWQVTQAEITDLDHDGQPEVALLLWRPFRPWPVDRWLPHGDRIAGYHDSTGRSCHFILVAWLRGAYRELWAGSALSVPVTQFAAADLDGDGWQELAVLNGSYQHPLGSQGDGLAVWGWNGFGFSIVSSMDGTFQRLSLINGADSRVYLQVQ